MTTNSFFHDFLSTPEQRQELMKSDTWHIVVALMNVMPGALRVGSIRGKRDVDAGFRELNAPHVKLVTDEGVLVAEVSTVSGKRGSLFRYSLDLAHSDSLTTSTWSELKSNRAKYIAGRIRSKDEDRGGLFHKVENAIFRAQRAKHHLAYAAMLKTIKKLYGRSPENVTISLDNDLTTLAARVFMGDLIPTQVPSHQASVIASQFNKFKERQAKLSESLNVVRDFFSRDKWVLVTNHVEGCKGRTPVIAGSFSGLPIVAAIDEFIRLGTLPHPSNDNNTFAYALNPEPLRVYESFEHIPDEMRKAIEMELVMYKINRGDDNLIPRMEPGSFHLWQEGGVLNWHDYSEGTVLFMDKA